MLFYADRVQTFQFENSKIMYDLALRRHGRHVDTYTYRYQLVLRTLPTYNTTIYYQCLYLSLLISKDP